MNTNDLLNPLTASINEELAERLDTDEDFLRVFIRTWAANEVAAELRNLRKLRSKRQEDVAELIGTGQSAIARIEKAAYDGWSLKTLVAIGEALKARPRFKFEPIEDVILEYRGVAKNYHEI